jgi:hypothetical protein
LPSGYAGATGTTSTSAVTVGKGRTGGTSGQPSFDDHMGEAGLSAIRQQTLPVSHFDIDLITSALLCPRCPCRSNNTWDLIARLVGSNVITSKWIFKHKFTQ